MNKMFASTLFALLLTNVALAGVKVTSVDLTTKGSNGFVSIALDGRSNDLPDVKVQGKTIEITLAKADGFSAIFKNVKGAQLSANSLNGKAVIKAVLPYEIAANSVDVGFKNSNIEVVFPRGKASDEKKVVFEDVGAPKEVKKPNSAPVAPQAATVENKVSKVILNEDYLNKLMKEDSAPKAASAKVDVISTKQASVIAKIDTKVPTSSPKLPTSTVDNFSFAGYAAKFTLFLALVLGLFYGVVQILKKGVFSKGKLSFLNNTKMIEVLSTTYIAPKRSLMIVKAHNQIFLVANSENGLTFLSEMTDTSGLLKEGEKLVTGSNFDMNLATSNDKEEADLFIKLKENIMESTPVKEEKGLASLAVAKDIVKFSDELKKKAKKLKPIEFN